MKTSRNTQPTVLLVEPRPRRSSDLQGCLATQGYRVLVVDSFLSALALLDGELRPRIDVLLTARQSGRLNGSDLVRWARRRRPKIKCLLIPDVVPCCRSEEDRSVRMPADDDGMLAGLRRLVPRGVSAIPQP